MKVAEHFHQDRDNRRRKLVLAQKRHLAEFVSEYVCLFSKCSGSTVFSMQSVTPAGAPGRPRQRDGVADGLIRDVARGRGGSVLIEGEPGIGKSTLVRAAVAGRRKPAARCSGDPVTS